MTARDRLTAIIAEEIRGDGWTCDCHEPLEPGECRDCDALHQRTAAHVADAIAQADGLIPEIFYGQSDSADRVDAEQARDQARAELAAANNTIREMLNRG